MRKLPLPLLDAGNVYRTCISKVRNLDLKQRLQAVESNVIKAAQSYTAAACSNQLFTVDTQTRVGRVTGEEMCDVYTVRMAKKGSPGRPFYDQLVLAAPNGTCPLCALRKVATLDHHLPKAHYPVLAIVPVNLVPSCTDCNKAKLDAIPETEEEQSLHPYFDDIDRDCWLSAMVIEGAPPAVRYYVNPPADWSSTLVSRVKKHFQTLKLANLYTANAADELISIRRAMEDSYAAGGSQAVRDELLKYARSFAAISPNFWRAVLYRALGDSVWFCSGGFRE